MDALQWSQLIVLAIGIAVFVILIIVLTRNRLQTDQTEGEQITHLDNKVNWLYGLAIAEAGLVVVMGILVFLRFMNLTK